MTSSGNSFHSPSGALSCDVSSSRSSPAAGVTLGSVGVGSVLVDPVGSDAGDCVGPDSEDPEGDGSGDGSGSSPEHPARSTTTASPAIADLTRARQLPSGHGIQDPGNSLFDPYRWRVGTERSRTDSEERTVVPPAMGFSAASLHALGFTDELVDRIMRFLNTSATELSGSKPESVVGVAFGTSPAGTDCAAQANKARQYVVEAINDMVTGLHGYEQSIDGLKRRAHSGRRHRRQRHLPAPRQCGELRRDTDRGRAQRLRGATGGG